MASKLGYVMKSRYLQPRKTKTAHVLIHVAKCANCMLNTTTSNRIEQISRLCWWLHEFPACRARWRA